jgi:O-antigen/teichoic acid export membrane protein
MAWPQILAMLLLLGLGTATSLRVAESDARVDNALGNAVLYCGTIGVLGLIVTLVLLPGMLGHLGDDAPSSARIASIALPVTMLGEVVAGIALGLGRVKRYNVARIVAGVTTLTINCLLVTLDAVSPQRVILGMLLGGLVGLGIAGVGLPWRRVAMSVATLRADLVYGSRVFLTSLLSVINARLDILLMTAFLAANQIGLYSIAINAMLPITVVAYSVATLIMPIMGRRRGDDGTTTPDYVKLIRRTALRYSLATAVIAVACAAVAPYAVPIIFGQAFQPAVLLVWILLPGFVAQGYAYIVDAGMIGMRQPWVGNLTQGAGVVCTLTLLPVLLPRYEAVGAAVTSSITYALTAAIAVWAVGRSSRSIEQDARAPEIELPVPAPVFSLDAETLDPKRDAVNDMDRWTK